MIASQDGFAPAMEMPSTVGSGSAISDFNAPSLPARDSGVAAQVGRGARATLLAVRSQ